MNEFASLIIFENFPDSLIHRPFLAQSESNAQSSSSESEPQMRGEIVSTAPIPSNHYLSLCAAILNVGRVHLRKRNINIDWNIQIIRPDTNTKLPKEQMQLAKAVKILLQCLQCITMIMKVKLSIFA